MVINIGKIIKPNTLDTNRKKERRGNPSYLCLREHKEASPIPVPDHNNNSIHTLPLAPYRAYTSKTTVAKLNPSTNATEHITIRDNTSRPHHSAKPA